jgi:methylglutaconyl-CoA hydratase
VCSSDLESASANSLSVTKQLINDLTNPTLDKDLDMAVQMNAKVRESEDFKNGIASFLNKQKINW